MEHAGWSESAARMSHPRPLWKHAIGVLAVRLALQSACSQPVGSCLANQLAELYAADVARVQAGTTPLYLISRWGGGQAGVNQVTRKKQHGLSAGNDLMSPRTPHSGLPSCPRHLLGAWPATPSTAAASQHAVVRRMPGEAVDAPCMWCRS